MASRIHHAALLLSLMMIAAGCVTHNGKEAQTLYDALGGKAGVAEIVNGMLEHIADDDRINKDFAAANIPRLRSLLEEQFCELTDGPCTYTGFSMQESHRGMTITETEFNAVVECLISAMNETDVHISLQNQLLARLAPLHGEIVYQ